MKYQNNLYPPPGFCERLRLARKNKGYSRRELGEKVNINPETVRSYERGHRIPTLTIIANIAVALDVTLDWLTWGDK